VWVNQNDLAQDGAINLSLADLGGTLVVEEALQLSEISPEGWQPIVFSPLWDSSENAYLLTLTSSTQDSDLRFAYSLRPEYLDGKLYENGEPIEQDLIFQYGCVAGWEKLQNDRQE